LQGVQALLNILGLSIDPFQRNGNFFAGIAPVPFRE